MEFQSTHSLRSATAFTMTMQKDSSFQSTHSLRSATGVLFCTVPRPPVSIHALLAECDAVVAVVAVGSGGFNPRTPCGVRLLGMPSRGARTSFNPRTPCGVRLSYKCTKSGKTRCFNPRTPCGVRLSYKCTKSGKTRCFNPRTPCGVRLSYKCTKSGKTRCFNPRTPCGVRLRPTLYIATQQSKSYFAPTSLKRPSLHGCSF